MSEISEEVAAIAAEQKDTMADAITTAVTMGYDTAARLAVDFLRLVAKEVTVDRERIVGLMVSLEMALDDGKTQLDEALKDTKASLTAGEPS